MHLSPEPLLDAACIRARVVELAETLRADTAYHPLLAVVVLHGARPFARDLSADCGDWLECAFVEARSYEGTESSGCVTFTGLDALELAGRHVLILEDILDTGRTLHALHQFLLQRHPASLRTCVLLDKPEGRVQAFEADWTGFSIPNAFVVGYGLDYNGDYRDLPDIRVLHP